MKKILLSMVLLGSICQESAAITADQVAGAGEIFLVVPIAVAMYGLYHDASILTQESKRWADYVRKDLQDTSGTHIIYEGNAVDIATLTDEQVLAIIGKDNFFYCWLAIHRALMIVGGISGLCFAAKGIGRFN